MKIFFCNFNYYNKAIITGIMLSFFIFTNVSSLQAQQQFIEIEIATTAEPKSALGIFFDSQKVVQQANTEFERIRPDLIIAKINYDKNSINFNSGFATAYIVTQEDELVFGSVKMLPPMESPNSIWKLPACSPRVRTLDVRIPIQEQLSYLDSLYQIRIKKREILRKEIKERLDEKTIKSLEEIETRFGLKYDKTMLEENIAYNLHIRLRKLRDAIKLYKSSKS